jgi:hypothetical protein
MIRRDILLLALLATRGAHAMMPDPIWTDARSIGLRCLAEPPGPAASALEAAIAAGAMALLARLAPGLPAALLQAGDPRLMEADRVVVLLQAGVQPEGAAISIRLWRNDPALPAGRLFFPPPRLLPPGGDAVATVAALLRPLLSGG